MKQKIIYTVLLIVCMYFPASSRECGEAVQTVAVVVDNINLAKKPAIAAEQASSLPVSLFSKLIYKL